MYVFQKIVNKWKTIQSNVSQKADFLILKAIFYKSIFDISATLFTT